MRDRYEEKELELDLEDRTGRKFIRCAQEIYMDLTQMHDTKQGRVREKLPAIRKAIEDLVVLSNTYEMKREKFTIPESIFSDYHFAKERYDNTKANPEVFRLKDDIKKQELESERATLADKIKNQELDFSHSEDERRHIMRDERKRIAEELTSLHVQKSRYEAQLTKAQHKCLPCFKKPADKLNAINEQITSLENELKDLVNIKRKSLEDRRYQLTLLHKRRWDIERAISEREDAGVHKVNRRQNAIDNAEVVMMVRRIDFDNAVDRYYSSSPPHVLHGYLNVYALISQCMNQPLENSDSAKKKFAMLMTYADKLYCPEITNRSVETLNKKIQILNMEDRNKVILQKPLVDRLPDILLRTLSVKSARDKVSVQGIYGKSLPNQNGKPVADNVKAAMLKIKN